MPMVIGIVLRSQEVPEWVEVVIELKAETKGRSRSGGGAGRSSTGNETDVWDEEREEHPMIECSSTLSLSLT